MREDVLMSERPMPGPPPVRRFDPDAVAWHPDAAEVVEVSGFDEGLIRAVLEHAQRSERAVTARGTAAVNLFRGDLIVTVGLAQEPPMVLSVRHRLREDIRGERKPGGVGTTIPTTTRELRRRAVAAGLRIDLGASHDKVVDPETGRVVATLASTPSDHRSIANSWSAIRNYVGGQHERRHRG